MGGAIGSVSASGSDSSFSSIPQLTDVCHAVSSGRKNARGPPRLYVEFIPKDEIELQRDDKPVTTEELSLDFPYNLQYLKELDHGLEHSTKGLVFWVTLFCEDIGRKLYFDLIRGILQEGIQRELNRKAEDMGLPYTVIFSDWWLDSGGSYQEGIPRKAASRDTTLIDSTRNWQYVLDRVVDTQLLESLRRSKTTSEDTENSDHLATSGRQEKRLRADNRLDSLDETSLIMDSKECTTSGIQSDETEHIQEEIRLAKPVSKEETLQILQADAEDLSAPQPSSSTDMPPEFRARLAVLVVKRDDYVPGDFAVPTDYATLLQHFLSGKENFPPKPTGLNTMSPYHFSEIGFLHSPTNPNDALHALDLASRLQVAVNDQERPVLLQPDGNVAFVSVGLVDSLFANGPGGAFWLPAHLPLVDIVRAVLRTDDVRIYSSNFLDESRKIFVCEGVTALECVSGMKRNDLLYIF